MSKKHSRRDLLKILGIGTLAASSPMELFLDSLLEGVLARAHAQANETLTSKYIFLQQYGAPPRWMYDLFLNPKGEAGKVMPNKSVASEFEAVGGRYTQAVYKTHLVKGIHSPVIWTHDVGTGNGGSRPMSDLMDNMLVLQGIDALNPGHIPAAGLQNRPLTHLSIDGALADQSNLPFGSLSFGGVHLDYKSEKGRSLKHYAGSQDIAKLIPEAFESELNAVHKTRKNQIDNAIARLNAGFNRKKLGSSSVDLDQKSARKLMQGELDSLSSEYPALLTKYENIIKETIELSKNLKGISDKPVGKTGVRSGDLLYSFTSNNTTVNNSDMRSALDAPRISNLAKQFAMTEYVIKHNLTSSVSLRMEYLTNLMINGSNKVLSNDQHFWGVMPSVLYTVVYFRISSACLLGLIDGLKATSYKGSNMFDHTVIRQSGEFGRHPKTNGAGSDHSPWSSNCMLLSGMIKKPIVAGEILKDGAVEKYRAGSWGLAGHLKHGPKATTGHVISTIAKMLGISSPSPNNPSLVVKNSSGSVELDKNYIDEGSVAE